MNRNILPLVFVFIFFVTGCGRSGFVVDLKGLEKSSVHVPGRVISNWPGYHWFGYYDKLQFDPSAHFVLGMEVNFEHRSPLPEDTVIIGMIDLQENDRWIDLGKSAAWSWQQGCMLQFIPNSDSLIIWNDCEKGKFISHLYNFRTRKERLLPFAVYALSPDGRHAVTTDFERIQDCRPGYGYAGITDANREKMAPDNAGIYVCNLETGTRDLIISYSQMVNMPALADSAANADRLSQKNWFNHLLFNTDGSRFIFLHRWKSAEKKDVGGFTTLMYTSDLSGSDIRLIDSTGYTSHFIWRDPIHITAWTRQPSFGSGFYVFTDGKPEETYILDQEKMPVNGHNTYLPGKEWILNDTYPDKDRFQHVYLYNLLTGVRIPLGDFYLPSEYKGEWRCDTHPRYSPDGKKICIDCPVGESGRQMVLLDISGIVK